MLRSLPVRIFTAVSFRHLRPGKLAVSLAGLLLGLTFTPDRAAASIIATSYNTPSGLGSEVGSTFELGQQITLTSLVTITSIDEALAHSLGPGDGSAASYGLALTIVNDVANTVGSTVLATDTGVTGNLVLTPTFDDINFTFGPTTLGPGTYWLVLMSLSGLPVQWEYQVPGTTNPSGAGGKIDSLSYISSTNQYSSDVFLTTINGTPEPVTGVTAFVALAAMAAIRWRQRPR